MAVSHSVLVILYHVLRDKKPYTALGADYFDKLDTARIERHHVHQLEQLGYTVTLMPKEAAWPQGRRGIFQGSAVSRGDTKAGENLIFGGIDMASYIFYTA